MMKKYRVNEVAKDLNVENKDVIEALKPFSDEPKKYMTALTEEDLDVVFDTFTKENSVESFDAYFAEREDAQPTSSSKEAPESKENTTAKVQEKAVVEKEKTAVKPAVKESKSNAANKNNKQTKPAAQKQEKTMQDKKDTAANTVVTTSDAVQKPAGRIVDTRTSQVNMNRYNEKYDRLASEKVKTDQTVNKQKLTQRSSQYRGKPKNSRKETEAERLKRIQLERQKKQMTITIPDEIVVNELALRLKATAAEVIKKLMMMGVMATVNDVIDFDTASLIAMEFHAKVEKEVVVTIEEQIIDDSEDEDDNLVPRAPVVVVMGHVDHGKTSLLDAIRKANVTKSEAGGITQHIGAYRVPVGDGEITFLDTPGHEAFTTMRARGAQVTDIAILVVAADDGIKPQTVEAISHAKAAGVSIIVAINKMDKPTANPDRVKEQLTQHEILPEEWGGDVPCMPISALTGEGIQELLEMVMLVADMKELKANPDRAAKGTVIEARLDKGREPIATILVQNGTLNIGDSIVAGTTVGRVRAMTNDRGELVKSARTICSGRNHRFGRRTYRRRYFQRCF